MEYLLTLTRATWLTDRQGETLSKCNAQKQERPILVKKMRDPTGKN